MHSKELFGCLCELTIWTGEDCKKYLVKGPKETGGKTILTPNNLHWCWFIDIAPRGYACPRAYERYLANPSEKVEGCPILLFEQGPSEEWVLAQEATDPPGTVAGRVGNARSESCMQCAGSQVDANHRGRVDQASKFEFHGLTHESFKPFVLPVQYRLPGTLPSRHPLLVNNGWYQLQKLRDFQGVDAKEFWIPHVSRVAGMKSGCMLQHLQGARAQAAEEVGKDVTDGVFEVKLNELMAQ